MLKQGLTVAGKALLVVVGVGYGVAKALDVLTPGPLSNDSAEKPAPESSTVPTPIDPVNIENPVFDRMEERLTRLENSVELLQASVERLSNRAATRSTENFVTRAELNAAMEQFSSSLDTDIERRFDIQNRSVQSLRTMVARTDELLEQVLENIESTSTPA